MCGIAGFIDFNKKSTVHELQVMTDILAHRGPDGSGYQLEEFENAQVGLGHRRLAIVDLTETGHQPMQFQNYWLSYNGEIYNYEEIKTELVQLGHSFSGSNDTEMILHAYAEWGEKCLHKFIGMFAFSLLDTLKNEVFFARDRVGVKPLFYYFNENQFLFASELKAFHSHPRFKKELNASAVASFMQFGNVPSDECIFNFCYKLKPGHFLKLNLKNQEFKEQAYWNVYDYYNQPKRDISFEEAKIEVSKLITSACNYRMVSDVPVGVFLSGGYDSSIVTAILQKESTEKLKTFTIGVPDLGLNEAPYAKDIANHLGTDHTEYTCSQKEAIELITDLPLSYDEPFGDSSAIPTTLVSKIAKRDVTVALSADGGDEVFAGYNRYDYMMRYHSKLNTIPSVIRKASAGLMEIIPANSIPILKNKYNFHNRYEKLKGILREPSPEQIMLSLSKQFTDEQLGKLMCSKTKMMYSTYQSKELIKDTFSPLSYMMAIDYQTYLVDDILQKVDRATMSQSLEGREPLLDHRIIEFAAQLPDVYKYKNGVKKYILKEIAHEFIPKELLDRPKMGFAIPIGTWMQKELKELVYSYINQKNIEEQGVFNWFEVERMMNLFYNGKKEYELKLWYLLMFQMWYSKWMK